MTKQAKFSTNSVTRLARRWPLASALAVGLPLSAVAACGPERYLLGEEPDAGAGTGGTNSSGGGGGVIAGGGASSTGASGMAGFDAGPAVPGLPTVEEVGCDYLRVIDSYCAVSGCHQQTATIPPAALLDLTPEPNLYQRLVDVSARHEDIDCDAAVGVQACVPPGCPSSAFLIDSQNPEASWLLAKILATDAGADTVDIGCGESMPLPSAQSGYSISHQKCLEDMVHFFAQMERERDAGP